MPIPDFQTIMFPLLKLAVDRKEHRMKDIVSKLAEQFNLTEEEKKELLPSGVALIFENRTHWARYYLKKAGLLDTF